MRSDTELQTFVDGLDQHGLVAHIGDILGWPIYYSRVETLRRRETAQHWFSMMHSQPDVWEGEARAFVKSCARDWPELASNWQIPEDKPAPVSVLDEVERQEAQPESEAVDG